MPDHNDPKRESLVSVLLEQRQREAEALVRRRRSLLIRTAVLGLLLSLVLLTALSALDDVPAAQQPVATVDLSTPFAIGLSVAALAFGLVVGYAMKRARDRNEQSDQARTDADEAEEREGYSAEAASAYEQLMREISEDLQALSELYRRRDRADIVSASHVVRAGESIHNRDSRLQALLPAVGGALLGAGLSGLYEVLGSTADAPASKSVVLLTVSALVVGIGMLVATFGRSS